MALDLGRDIAATGLYFHGTPIGVMLIHPYGGTSGRFLCAATLYWSTAHLEALAARGDPYTDEDITEASFTRIGVQRLSIREQIVCSCGLKGRIRDGRWID